MGFWSGLGKIGLGIGSLAAAPWSGGASLALLGPIAGGGAALASGVSDLARGGSGGGGSEKGDAAIRAVLGDLQEASAATRARGEQLSGLSTEALAPVLQYFQQLIGGDQQALLAATRPERARVMDQYDAARKAISEFSPRGGGANAALAQSQFAEAGDLANITAMARRQATAQGAQVGTQLAGLGLSADQLASADLGTILNALLGGEQLDVTRRGQNMQTASGLGEAVGTLLGMMLTRQEQTTQEAA